MTNALNTARQTQSNITKEVVVLAGGYGTRLSSIVPGLPKVLAPVAGRPFLAHVIDYLRMQGVERFVFSLGYRADQVEKYLKENHPTLHYTTVTENEPLGTGGGIRLALQKTKQNDVLVVNGDTLFKVDVTALFQYHHQSGAECTVALKPWQHTERFGTVVVGRDGKLLCFAEKKQSSDGLINGGVYVLSKKKFFRRSFPPRFSFEKDYLETFCSEGSFYGREQEGFFIDIGLPETYEQAQTDLAPAVLDLKNVDKSWTLFIDRDGVINEETVGEYVLHWNQFIFSKGVLQSFKKLSDAFGRLILVTNQRGIGKGLMTKEALDNIHYEMQREIGIAGGHLDKIYHCSDVDNRSFFRKPNPGMAWQATQDFPGIDLRKSIMVGNKPSDMRFGRAAGIFTVFLATTNPDEPFPHPDVDLRFGTLAEFAASLP